MSEYVVTDTELTAVANAIRTKGGTSADLEWNADFISAINAISGGGEGAKNILGGTAEPTSAIGVDGDIYLRYLSIPDTYKPIEYLGSDGNGQYINTGIKPDESTEVDVDVEFDSLTSTWRVIFGSNYANVNTSFIVGAHSGELTVQLGSNNYSNVNTSILTNQFYKYVYKDGDLYIDDTFITSVRKVVLNSNYPMYLFGCNMNGNLDSNPFIGKIRKFIVKKDGDIGQYLVAVKRISDNVVGMYDLITDTFFTNAGSGSFTSGNETTFDDEIIKTYCKVSGSWQSLIGQDIDDVNTKGGGGVLSGESAPSASLGSDGDLYVQKMDLPDDVNFVEYLKSSGTQYINTGVYATQDIDATVTSDRGSGTSGSSANIGCALGVRTGGFSGMSKTIYFGSHIDNNGGISVIKTGSSNEGTVSNKTGVSTRRTKTHKDVNGYYTYCSTIDEVASYAKMYRQTGSWQSDHTLYMFAFYNSDTFSSANSAKVHRVTLYDKGVPIKDYLPCLDDNDVPCMWDNIAKEYVYNDGTGTFAYGNTVTPTKISDVLYEKKNGAWVYVGDVDDVNTGE